MPATYVYVPTGQYGSLSLTVGNYIDPLAYYSEYGVEGPNPFGPEHVALYDMTGRWESDQYGRPFDLNNLLAPGTAPS